MIQNSPVSPELLPIPNLKKEKQLCIYTPWVVTCACASLSC